MSERASRTMILGVLALGAAAACSSCEERPAIRADDHPRTLGAGPRATSAAAAPIVPVDAAAAVVAIPADFLLRFERTRCYGTCPGYEVTVERTGALRFVGQRGCTQRQLAPGQVASLVELLDTNRFFDLPDATEVGSTDQSSVFLTVRMRDQKKRVEHYLGAAITKTATAQVFPRFRAVEEGIDEITGANRLVDSPALVRCAGTRRFR